jgi:hypothetical protein
MCGADAGCLAINYQSLSSDLEKRDVIIDNLLVRIHFIIVKVRWTGLTPCECRIPFSR